MKLTPQERANRRAAFRRMTGPEKLDYIFSYYKLPIVLALLLAYAAGYGIYRTVSRKEVLLYAAYVNVAVGEEADGVLSGDYVRAAGGDPTKSQVYVYHSLYLSDDPTLANHQYAYASRLKLLAAIDAEQLDVVLMNREAWDLLSASGYLLELPPLLEERDPALYRRLAPYLMENDVILQDNALEYQLNEAAAYQAETVRQVNAVEITPFPRVQAIGFTDTVYGAVLPNSPRLDGAVSYLAYLSEGGTGSCPTEDGSLS